MKTIILSMLLFVSIISFGQVPTGGLIPYPTKTQVNTELAKKVNYTDGEPASVYSYSKHQTDSLQTLQLNLLGGTVIGTVLAPTAAPGTNSPQVANTNFVLGEKSIVSELNQMGCAFKSVTFGWTCLTSSATGITMVDGTVYFVLLDRITSSQTITGINAVNSTAGSYTADNTNGAALYLWNAGALTLVAQSATNLEAQYKTTATAKLTFPLSSPYSASIGVYYAAFLYNSSAQTTAPVLHGSASFAGAQQVFLPSTLRICGSLAGQATFPASTTVGALTNAANPPISILY